MRRLLFCFCVCATEYDVFVVIECLFESRIPSRCSLLSIPTGWRSRRRRPYLLPVFVFCVVYHHLITMRGPSLERILLGLFALSMLWAPSRAFTTTSSHCAKRSLLVPTVNPRPVTSPIYSVSPMDPSSNKSKEPSETTDVSDPGVEAVLVQAGLAVAAVAVTFVVGTTLLNVATDVSSHALVALGQGAWHLLVVVVQAVAQGVMVVVPAVLQALVALVQWAIPVLREAAEKAAPYVDQAATELSTAAAPYIDQAAAELSPYVQQVTAPIQSASDAVTQAVDATVQSATTAIQSQVDSASAAVQAQVDGATAAVQAQFDGALQSAAGSVDATMKEATRAAQESLSSS